MTEVLILALFAVLIYLLGIPVHGILYGKKGRERNGYADVFLHGICVLLGTAEAVHLAAVLCPLTVDTMAGLLAGLLSAGVIVSLVYRLFEKKKEGRGIAPEKKKSMQQKKLLPVFILFGGSVILQMLVICAGSYRGGDITLETVRTFLAENTLYTHNPLTGQVYTAGIPLRLKILCLPGLYAAVCRLTGSDVRAFVEIAVPILVLFGSYLAYYRLGRAVFGENTGKVWMMLLVVSLLLWGGGYLLSMDGFQLLHCGYRGTAIRNGILVPFVLSMCLEKRYRSVILGILAEACIVWTFYGLGVCAAVAVILYLLQKLCSCGKEGDQCGS